MPMTLIFVLHDYHQTSYARFGPFFGPSDDNLITLLIRHITAFSSTVV